MKRPQLPIPQETKTTLVVSSDDLFPGSTLRSSELTLIMYGCIGAGRRSSYIMAAIDRLVHHSVILDMMSVESYRAQEASQQHLSSTRPEKPSSKRASLDEAVASLRDAAPSSRVTQEGPLGSVGESLSAQRPGADSSMGNLLSADAQSARLIATDGTV